MDVASIIKKGIERKKVSYTELAKYADVSNTTITGWINGRMLPSSDKLIKIVSFLDIVDDIFPKDRNVTLEKRVEYLEKELDILKQKEENRYLREENERLKQEKQHIEQQHKFIQVNHVNREDDTRPNVGTDREPVQKKRDNIVIFEPDKAYMQELYKIVNELTPDDIRVDAFEEFDRPFQWIGHQARDRHMLLFIFSVELEEFDCLRWFEVNIDRNDYPQIRDVPILIYGDHQHKINKCIKYAQAVIKKPYDIGELEAYLAKYTNTKANRENIKI